MLQMPSVRILFAGAAPLNNAGPLAGATNGYWVDIRDLFLYGDQFVNYDLITT